MSIQRSMPIASTRPFPKQRFLGNKSNLASQLDKTAERWNTNAQAWNHATGSGGNVYHQKFLYPAVMQFVGSTQGKDILDLGCGEGAFCRIFAQTAHNVTGIDISQNMLKIARQKKSKNIRYLHRSFTHLQGVPDLSQDLVFSNMAFMSSPGLSETFRESYRVLKPGGQFIFIIKHPFRLWQQHQDTASDVSYFDERPFEHKTDLGYFSSSPTPHPTSNEITSIHYRRTFSTYLNQLRQTGFEFDAMEEPYPTSETIQYSPQLKALSLKPSLLIIRAIKPKLSLIT
jgi:ubiquinone/menaquinone biosynthesis C-methylase UbiE